jgi:hypothetical protein
MVLLKVPPAPTALSSLSIGRESMSASSNGTNVTLEPESTKPMVVRDSLLMDNLI